MGAALSCTSNGALLVVAAANGDVPSAHELLKKHPRTALYHNYRDRTSPLIQASARGHFDLVQLILETAVMTCPDKAKRHCIDHTNTKHQTALIVACKHGHPDCVEYLVTNGADPLVFDERRHNTCLHFAALYGHSDCCHKLLSSRSSQQGDQGRQLTIAQIVCRDEDDTTNTCFVDRHNGWGLTALHIAVFQGSVHTVRALLRHGASLESSIVPAKIENSPIRCAIGSTALHIAALIGNIAMAKVILEAQESVPGLELRSRTDALGLRPQEYAQRARNPVLVHLLDERLPVALLRQIWMNYSLEQALPPRHQTLGAMLQKLKLMLNLEIIALQRNLASSAQQQQADAAEKMACAAAAVAAGGGVAGGRTPPMTPSKAAVRSAIGACAAPLPRSASGWMPHAAVVDERTLWSRRLDQVQVLLTSVSTLLSMLQGLCDKSDGSETSWPPGSPGSHEAVLDFILSTLITPRTVSAIVHAAKKLVCSNVMAMGPSGGGGTHTLPPDIEVQHGMALLTTALRAVDTCLQAATYLSNPASMMTGPAAVAAAAASACGQAAAVPADGSEPPALAVDPVTVARVRANSSRSPSFTVSTANATIGMGAASIGRTSIRSGETNLIVSDTSGGQLVTVPSNAVLLPPPPSVLLPASVGGLLPIGSAGGASAAALLGLPPGMAAAMGQSQGVSLFTSHWSAHLHSLIAQLHWDIGVQRHRRRRQHAAAAAARTAAVAATVASAAQCTAAMESSPSPALQPSPETLNHSRSAGNAVSLGQGAGADARGGAEAAPSSPSGVPQSPLPTIECRRGDAPQDVLGSDAVSRAMSMELRGDGGARVPVSLGAAGGAAGGLQSAVPHLSVPGVLAASAGGGQNRTVMHLGAYLPLVGLGEISPRSGGTSAPPPLPVLPVHASAVRPASKCVAVEASAAMARAMSGEAVDDDAAGGKTMGGEESEEEEEASIWSEDDGLVCSICMDQPVAVLVTGCQHGLCVQCAFQLTVKGRELPCCPFCRQKIPAFEAKPLADLVPAGQLTAVKGGGGRSKTAPPLQGIR